MAETAYIYSIQGDMPSGKVNTTKLAREVVKSSISTQLARIDTDEDVLLIVFADALSVQDKTTLDGDTTAPAGGLLADHDHTKGLRLLMGDELDYQFVSVPVANEIQFVLVEDDVPEDSFGKIEVYVISQGASAGTLRVGVYSAVDGEPHTKIAEGALSFAPDQDELLDDTLVKIAISPLAQPGEPFFLAFLSTVATIELLSTDDLVGAVHPIRFQQTLDGLLPAEASASNASATAIYAALVE